MNNKLIAITGGMSSGKTTLCNKIKSVNKQVIHIDVDIFRKNLYKNKKYINELSNIIIELKDYNEINSTILNKYIYDNEEYMKEYKKLLYKYLFEYINTFNNKTILVDWALIINDNLHDKFDKIIYIDCNYENRISRLKDSDLSKTEIEKRFKLQEINDFPIIKNLLIVNNDNKINTEEVINFIDGLNCKFTLPNNEGKAIWEITHNCNYGCSYCIFACDKKKVEGELTTEECKHVIDELVKNNFKHLKITGGEPFIRKDIIEVLEYASTKLIVDISTNASLLTSQIVEELNKINLKMIHVSLDGNKTEHESVRGTNTYNRTIKGLELLKNSKNKIRIGTVIHKNNENSLENILKILENYKVDNVIFSIMEPIKGQDKSNVRTKNNIDLIKELDVLKEKYKNKLTVNYNFDVSPNYVKKCPAGEKFIYINNFGKVSPCPWVYEKNKKCISDKSLGNNTLKEILESETFKKFNEQKESGKCYGEIL